MEEQSLRITTQWSRYLLHDSEQEGEEVGNERSIEVVEVRVWDERSSGYVRAQSLTALP